jgi:hypothetical protein
MPSNIQAISTEELKEPPKAEVFDRLSLSMILFTCEHLHLGMEAGRRWAEQGASYEQLERLMQSCYAYPPPPSFCCCRIAMIACGGDEDQARDFWEGLYPECHEDISEEIFVVGFIDGATELLNEAKPLI